jgi:hypothetical protein
MLYGQWFDWCAIKAFPALIDGVKLNRQDALKMLKRQWFLASREQPADSSPCPSEEIGCSHQS